MPFDGRSLGKKATPDEIKQLRKDADQRLNSMETVRWSWWMHWRLLARYIQPRLGRFIPQQNIANRGSPRMQHIVNSTATVASRNFGAGMLSSATSPARPWFMLKTGDKSEDLDPDAKLWLEEVARRMRRVFSESNFYRAIATMYEALGVFGTCAMLIYQDFHDVINCVPLATGEYYLAVDERLRVATLYRRFMMSVQEIVGRFTKESVSVAVLQLWNNNQRDKEIIVCHAVEKNLDDAPGANGLAWREIYWEWGQSGDLVLELKGYHDKPFIAARWNVEANDAYGRSCGMDALGDVIQIQIEEKRKAQLVEKAGNPPLIADARLRNEPASTIPGAVTYVAAGASGAVEGGMKPMYMVDARAIAEMNQDIGRCELRVKSAFFEDLFLAISQMEGVQPRNEMEIGERKAEKMLMLGPPLERVHNELLGESIERTFSIMARNGLIPPAPPSLAGQFLQVEFISDLARAQKASDTVPIERIFQFGVSLVEAFPQVVDNYDADEAVRIMGDLIGTPAKVLASKDAIARIRAQRQQQQNMATALQAGQAAASAGADASKIDVGGGVNAVQRMLGTG